MKVVATTAAALPEDRAERDCNNDHLKTKVVHLSLRSEAAGNPTNLGPKWTPAFMLNVLQAKLLAWKAGAQSVSIWITPRP